MADETTTTTEETTVALNFVTIASNTGAEAYVSVDATNGAVVLIPDKAVVKMSAATLKTIADTRKDFEYAKLLKDIRLKKKSTGKVTVLEASETTLQAIDLVLNMPTDNPILKIRDMSLETGNSTNTDLGTVLSDTVLRMATSAGIVSDKPDIVDIQYVDELPNETAADNDSVYLKGGKYFKVNAEEDGYDEITGTIEVVPKLYNFTSKAAANTLYNLTTKYTSEWNEIFERGVYTYDTTTNKAILTDLVIKEVKVLPETGEANVIYKLLKATGDKAKGSLWKYEGEEFKAETRTLVTDSTVPFEPLAKVNTYYNVANSILKKAVSGNKYETVGTIIEIPNPNQLDLPNVEKITVPEGTVFVLNKADGNKAKGSKWIFDFDQKKFLAFPIISTDVTGPTLVEGEDENP